MNETKTKAIIKESLEKSKFSSSDKNVDFIYRKRLQNNWSTISELIVLYSPQLEKS